MHTATSVAPLALFTKRLGGDGAQPTRVMAVRVAMVVVFMVPPL